MVLTPSTMQELGSRAPALVLPDVFGHSVGLDDFVAGRPFLVMFISKHCPYVQHIASGLAELGRDYADKGLAILAVSSNDIENYPDDAPEELAGMAREFGFTFPVLFDETQEVAKRYRAACTPDFFLYDKEKRLVYRGQFDESRPGKNSPVTGGDVSREELVKRTKIILKQLNAKL